MKHAHKFAQPSADVVATNDADVFIFHAGAGPQTIAGFGDDDRVMVDWFGSYSDITTLSKLTDGLDITTVTGGVIHVGVYDYDHDGALDTVVSNDSGDLVAILGQSDLNGWHLMGG